MAQCRAKQEHKAGGKPWSKVAFERKEVLLVQQQCKTLYVNKEHRKGRGNITLQTEEPCSRVFVLKQSPCDLGVPVPVTAPALSPTGNVLCSSGLSSFWGHIGWLPPGTAVPVAGAHAKPGWPLTHFPPLDRVSILSSPSSSLCLPCPKPP